MEATSFQISDGCHSGVKSAEHRRKPEQVDRLLESVNYGSSSCRADDHSGNRLPHSSSDDEELHRITAVFRHSRDGTSRNIFDAADKKVLTALSIIFFKPYAYNYIIGCLYTQDP